MDTKKADDMQINGTHYKKCPPEYQHWSLVTIHGWDYFQAQIIKYIMRFRDKGGVTDLKKAQHFLAKLIELEEEKQKTEEKPDEATPVPAPVKASPPEGVRPFPWTIGKDGHVREERPDEVVPAPPLPFTDDVYSMSPKNLIAEKGRASYQGLPNAADGVQEPRSSYDFTYEGGTSKIDMYRCKKCRKHFEIPLGSMPGMYHNCEVASATTNGAGLC